MIAWDWIHPDGGMLNTGPMPRELDNPNAIEFLNHHLCLNHLLGSVYDCQTLWAISDTIVEDSLWDGKTLYRSRGERDEGVTTISHDNLTAIASLSAMDANRVIAQRKIAHPAAWLFWFHFAERTLGQVLTYPFGVLDLLWTLFTKKWRDTNDRLLWFVRLVPSRHTWAYGWMWKLWCWDLKRRYGCLEALFEYYYRWPLQGTGFEHPNVTLARMVDNRHR